MRGYTNVVKGDQRWLLASSGGRKTFSVLLLSGALAIVPCHVITTIIVGVFKAAPDLSTSETIRR